MFPGVLRVTFSFHFWLWVILYPVLMGWCLIFNQIFICSCALHTSVYQLNTRWQKKASFLQRKYITYVRTGPVFPTTGFLLTTGRISTGPTRMHAIPRTICSQTCTLSTYTGYLKPLQCRFWDNAKSCNCSRGRKSSCTSRSPSLCHWISMSLYLDLSTFLFIRCDAALLPFSKEINWVGNPVDEKSWGETRHVSKII